MMRISELAKRAGCTVEVVRFYEGVGVLPAPRRLPNGYRDYQPVHVQRLAFVRRCRDLGISLKEVVRLLALADDAQAHCEEVNAMIDEHIRQVQERLHALELLHDELQNLRHQCNGQAPQCGILQELKPH